MPTASASPLIGANLAINNIDRVADITHAGVSMPPFKLLSTVFGDDGRKYTYAKANAALASGLATCAIAGTGLVAATGGTFIAPTITGGMVTGDCAWFAQASVA